MTRSKLHPDQIPRVKPALSQPDAPTTRIVKAISTYMIDLWTVN